jgi:hypothetical protein
MKRIFLNKKYLLSLGGAAIFAIATYVPTNAFAAVSMVQNSAQVDSNTCVSPSTRIYSYPSNVTSGNLLIATIGYKSSADTIPTPTDTLSNTWTKLWQNTVTSGTSSDRALAIYYATANSSGADSITVTCPTSVSGRTQGVDMVLHEVSGADISGNPAMPFTTPFDSSTSFTDNFSFSNFTSGDMKIVDGFSVNSRNVSTPSSSQGGSWDQKSARGTIGDYYAVYNGTQSALNFDWLDTSTGLATSTQWSGFVLRVKPL